MSEQYTTTTTTSYGQRLGGSCKGIAGGFVMVLVAIALLVWNEHNAVQSHRSIDEAEKLCLSVPSIDVVSTSNANKLIHVSGLVEPTGTPIAVDKFHVIPPQPALKLQRMVEMYQWTQDSSTKETKKAGGSTERETTYTYHKEWLSHVVDASSFYYPGGHENPGVMPFPQQVFVASGATMGAFDVPPALLNRINFYQRLSPANYSTAFLPAALRANYSVFVYQDAGYYFGNDPASPQIGDTRVTFTYVPQQVVSVIAKQTGSSLTGYVTSNKRTMLLVESGTVSAEEMFLHASKQVTLMAWFLRALGFVLLWMGLKAIVQPISVAGDVLPLVGNILEAGADIVTFLLALMVSTVIVALSWFVFRPWLSLGLLAVVGGASYFVWRCKREQKRAEPEVYVAPVDVEAYPTEKTSLM